MPNLATIDIGTNTTLLLVARGEPRIEAIAERAEITRLGRGIGRDGRLGADGIARTLAVLRDYAAIAHAHGARIAAIGTEALRRAPNAREFLDTAAEILGGPVEVIDGKREAALTFKAVAASFPELARGRLAVIDIGGGSTEIVLANGGTVGFEVSLPIGSVRLTERFVHHDPALSEETEALAASVDEALAAVPFTRAGGAALVGVAGTVTTLAAMAQDLADYDPARVHGYRLPRGALGAQIDRLRSSSQREREQMAGLDPRRADVILAGALILERIAGASSAAEVVVSDRGIRWGLLYEILERRDDA
jgi:exopolyphosphatase/guanosine-5'-triphosphate,3'-diphosphate pyrophosphatase